jgi:3-hydroxyisobutyrate dehydrogenase
VTTLRLGFLGLGQMGHPMAANIAAAGFELLCFDPAGTEERLPSGAVVATSAADVFAGTDTVLLSVPDGAATMAVVEDLCATPQRRVTTVIDLSTVGPAVAADAAKRLARVGVTYVDGPVSGGAAGARAATISLMFGGPTAVLEAHRDVLASFCGSVFHVGEHAGQGQAMKLLNNFLSATALAATSEAVAFGLTSGLEMDTMLEVLNASTGRNSATVDKFPNRIATGTFDAGFRTALMAKDLRLYTAAVKAAGAQGSVGMAVSDMWQQADGALPGSDFTQIWQFVSGPAQG